MADLCDLTCEACRADAPKVSAEEQETLIKDIDGWAINTDPCDMLVKKYNFDSYDEAVSFTNAIAEMATKTVLAHQLDSFSDYSLFYLIRIITRDLDQPFVSKLLIIRKSCISLKSVTFWEEYDCIKNKFLQICAPDP